MDERRQHDNEVLERLVRIETKLEEFLQIKSDVNDNEKRIRKIENQQSKLAGIFAVVGGLILAAIEFVKYIFEKR